LNISRLAAHVLVRQSCLHYLEGNVLSRGCFLMTPLGWYVPLSRLLVIWSLITGRHTQHATMFTPTLCTLIPTEMIARATERIAEIKLQQSQLLDLDVKLADKSPYPELKVR